MIKASVKVKLKGLQRYREVVEQDLRGGGAGPIRACMKQWAARYRSWAQERFTKFSRGGGDWPPLSPRTIAGRRKGKGGGLVAAILRNLGLLFQVLSPTFAHKPGQLEEQISMGVRVGYGGPGSYPKGRATIADIASFHQMGGAHLPQRKIIVDPPQVLVGQMADDMTRALQKLDKMTSGGA